MYGWATVVSLWSRVFLVFFPARGGTVLAGDETAAPDHVVQVGAQSQGVEGGTGTSIFT